MKKIAVLLTAGIIALALAACGGSSESGADSAAAQSETADDETESSIELSDDVTIDYEYLSKKECAEVLSGLDDYYDSLNQKSMDFFAQKKGVTKEEYREYSAEQACEITDDEKAYLDKIILDIETNMAKEGMKFPKNKSISIALTTMSEVYGATGYTHGTTAFLSKSFIDICLENPSEYAELLQTLVSHELFHCLTRNNPEFRKDMYNIISFKIADSEFDIPDDIYEQMIINPDVEKHDSYAEFTINGEKKNCYLVFLTKDNFENPGDSLFTSACTGLVDVNDGTLYTVDDSSDFWEVVGENTDYCEDPEECMAVNFSYAVTCGLEGPNGNSYETPAIIKDIITYLQK